MFRRCLNQVLRLHSTQAMFSMGRPIFVPCTVENQNGFFRLVGENFESHLTYIWLRDHCRSPTMYNSSTHQRNSNIVDLKPDVKPMKFTEDETCLVIQWNDGHRSVYSKEWLIQNSPNLQQPDEYMSLKTKIRPWNQETVRDRDVSIDYEAYMSTDQGIQRVLNSLVINGFALVEGITDLSLELGTLATVERMVRIQSNLFGQGFQFTSKSTPDVSDTAYSQDFLLPHNDMTYLEHAAGLQIFHVLQESDKGGETILVDGFEVARQYKDSCPEGYTYFSVERSLESEYIHQKERPHEHCYNNDFIFKHYPNSDLLKQVRYNVYDRAPHKGLMTVKEQEKFYNYYIQLSRLFQSPENAIEMKLKPGSLLFIDNFRVLHGRKGFQGSRVMSGCYVERSDFLSKAKVFHVL